MQLPYISLQALVDQPHLITDSYEIDLIMAFHNKKGSEHYRGIDIQYFSKFNLGFTNLLG